jgi:hypothetical protein
MLAASADFAGWLQAQPALTIVGTSHDPLGDPLASFIRATSGRVAAVGYDALCLAAQVVALPPWACRYQRLIDELPRATPVTARQALQLLTTACATSAAPPATPVQQQPTWEVARAGAVRGS